MRHESWRVDVDAIEWEAIAELCPAAARRFQEALDRHKVDEETFANSYWPHMDGDSFAEELEYCSDDPGEAALELVTTWNALCLAFENATRVGTTSLSLKIGWLDTEDEYYDKESPVCYAVENAYQLSPTGEKFKDRLKRVPGYWFNVLNENATD